MLAICLRPLPIARPMALTPTRTLAVLLVKGLQQELDLTPKPGLVDCWDNGSHDDLNHQLMTRSIALLARYFAECVTALEAGQPIEQLRLLGIAAEQEMLAQLKTNTHRGAIFLGGLLLGAVHAAASLDGATVSTTVARCARRLFATGSPVGTNGSTVRGRFRAGGIVREALSGLSAVFEIGVSALYQAERQGFSQRDGLLLTMARLMQTVEDTTALHRCGPVGLIQLQRDGAILETLLLNGNDPLMFLMTANRRYRQQRLTMGGVADLLAISVAWWSFESQVKFRLLLDRGAGISDAR